MIWKRLFGKDDAQQGAGRKVREVHGESVIEYTQRSGSEPPAEEQVQVGWQPVNALEEQMAQIPGSVDAQFAFARMLLESQVLLATASAPEKPTDRTLENDENFDVVCVDDNKGG